MKTIIATMLLLLAANQANAEGFYQLATAKLQKPAQAVNTNPGDFDYTPLYRQVVPESGRDEMIAGPASRFSYTPLYRQVLKISG